MIETDLRTETSALLSALIQINTTNPPGNETTAAEFLEAYLAEAGVESTLVGSQPDRKNLVARIPGRGDGPSLMLLGHTDVVVADPAEWSVPPFAGLDKDGQIWGRGALDMKGQVAAETVAFVTLAREGWQGNGDLVLCAVADEEVGQGIGAEWIVRAHPDLVRTDFVLNEGGGERLVHDGKVVYNVDVGEKMCSAFEITVHGRSAHASTANITNNAVTKLVPVIERIDRMARPEKDLPELPAFLAAIGAAGADPGALVAAAQDGNPALAECLAPMLGAVITPTGLEGSPRASVNVVPGKAVLRCDCRILPGKTQDELKAAVEAALGGHRARVRLHRRDGRHQLVGREPALRRDRAVPPPDRGGRVACPDHLVGVHRQPLLPHGLRQHRLRVHAEAHRPARDLAAPALLRRARLEGRPGARRAVLPLRSPRRRRALMSTEVERTPGEKVRLGGMALRNGIMVHSFDHWAVAVRTPEGEIKLASGKKPELPAALVGTPVIRGVARMAEVAYILPTMRRRLPEARLPFEAPGMGAALVASAVISTLARRSRLPAAAAEVVSVGMSLVPALMAIKGSDVAGYHGAEHKAIGGYEQDTDAIDVTKEHERCGSHMVGPMLVASAVGSTLVARMPAAKRGPARFLTGIAAIGVAAESFSWMTKHPENPIAKGLGRPGYELQRVAATREPTPEELAVAKTALNEVLRLEGVDSV